MDTRGRFFAPLGLQAGNHKGFASNGQHGDFLGEGREKVPGRQLGEWETVLQ